MDVRARCDVGKVLDSGQDGETLHCEARQQLVKEKEIPRRSAVTSSDLNNDSVALRLECGRFSVLLTEDIEHEGEEALLGSGQALSSLVLKVPHHGGDNTLTPPLLQAVKPQLAVISVGSDKRFGHPDELTLEKLAEMPPTAPISTGT